MASSPAITVADITSSTVPCTTTAHTTVYCTRPGRGVHEAGNGAELTGMSSLPGGNDVQHHKETVASLDIDTDRTTTGTVSSNSHHLLLPPCSSTGNEPCENSNTSNSHNNPQQTTHGDWISDSVRVAEKWMLVEQTLVGCPKTPVSILAAFRVRALRSLSILAPQNESDTPMDAAEAQADDNISGKVIPVDDDAVGRLLDDEADTHTDKEGGIIRGGAVPGHGQHQMQGVGTSGAVMSGTRTMLRGGTPSKQYCYMKDRLLEVDRIVDLLADAQANAILDSSSVMDGHHRFVEGLIGQALHRSRKRLDTPIVPVPIPPATVEASVQTSSSSHSNSVCRSPMPSHNFPSQQPKSPYNVAVLTIGGTPLRKPTTGTRAIPSKSHSRTGTPQRGVLGHTNDTPILGSHSGRPRVAQKSAGTSTGKPIGTSNRPVSRGETNTSKKHNVGGDNKDRYSANRNPSTGNLVVLGSAVDRYDELGLMAIGSVDDEVTVVVPDSGTLTCEEKLNFKNSRGVECVNDSDSKMKNIISDVFVLRSHTAGITLSDGFSPVVALQPVDRAFELKSVDVVNQGSTSDNVVIIEPTCSTGVHCTTVVAGNLNAESHSLFNSTSDNNGDEFVRTAGDKVLSNTDVELGHERHKVGTHRLSGTKRSLDIATELALAAERGDRDALDRLIVAIQRNATVNSGCTPHTADHLVADADLSPENKGCTDGRSSNGGRRRFGAGREQEPSTRAANASRSQTGGHTTDTEAASGSSKSTAAANMNTSAKIENPSTNPSRISRNTTSSNAAVHGATTRLAGVSSRSCAKAAAKSDAGTGADTTTAPPPLTSRRTRAVSQNSATSSKSEVVKSEHSGVATGVETNTDEAPSAGKAIGRRKKGVVGVPAVTEKTATANASTRATVKTTVKRVLKRRKVTSDLDAAASDDNVPNNDKRAGTKVEECEATGTPRAA
eukprot:Lankesteria_metandrocarpae@DN5268_c1_g1_i6.p1